MKTPSISLRLLLLLVLLAAGPMIAMRLNHVALWLPFERDAGATLVAEEGPVEVLHAFRGVNVHQPGSRAISGAGDADGDGHGDLFIMGRANTKDGGGVVALVSGATGKTMRKWSLPDWEREPLTVELVGDVDADGTPDVLIGQGRVGHGLAPCHWICSGKSGKTLIDLQGRTFRNGPILHAVGDVDDDGVADILSANFEGTELLSGRTGARLLSFDAQNAVLARSAADVDGDGTLDLAVAVRGDHVVLLSGADGSEILRVLASPAVLSTGGAPPPDVCLELVGDLDGDGRGDLLFGFRNTTRPRVEVRSGARDRHLYTIDGDGGAFGTSITGLGDLDGDGLADFAVGAPRWNTTSVPGFGAPGAVTVHSGADGAVLRTIRGHGLGHRLGSCVVDVGDVDGDGTHDLAVEEPGARDGGTIWVLSGASLAR